MSQKLSEKYFYKSKKGLDESVVREISRRKKEPGWMTELRLAAYEYFTHCPLPAWGGDLKKINFNEIYYYINPTGKKALSWEDLPEEIKTTYDRIGIPQAEKKMLIAGVSAQYESEVVYKNIQSALSRKGVVFLDMDTAVREHPDVVKRYFGTVVQPNDNKFSSLNSAVWSGGSFIYVPPGIRIDLPLQAYFQINASNFGQFERTLIIADEDSFVHYIEGCTAPVYSTDSLHAAVVEIIIKKKARVRYTTVQNWSQNVYNLTTKRMFIESEGVGEWIDCNLGSKITMKYPSMILGGRKAKGEVLSLSYAGAGQHQDTGAKAICLSPDTSARIISKSVSCQGGRTSFRGLVKAEKTAFNAAVKVHCDALIIDPLSRSDTYPLMDIKNNTCRIEHEATVSKISKEILFYLMSRGLPEDEAEAMIVNGFIEPIVKELPFEYAIEMNRLIRLEMSESVG